MEKETRIKLSQELKECETRIAEMHDEVHKVLEVGKLLKNILEANDVKEVLLASPVYSRFALENPIRNLDDGHGTVSHTVSEYGMEYKLDPDHVKWVEPEWIGWEDNEITKSKFYETLTVAASRFNSSIIVRLGIIDGEIKFTSQTTLIDEYDADPLDSELLPESDWLTLSNVLDTRKWLKIAKLLLTNEEVWQYSNNFTQFHRLSRVELEEQKKISLPDVFDYAQLESDGNQDIVTFIRFSGEWEPIGELYSKLRVRPISFDRFKFFIYNCMTAAPELDWGTIKNTTLYNTYVIDPDDSENSKMSDIFSNPTEPSLELAIYFTDITIKRLINNLHSMFPNLQMVVVMANGKHILASNTKHVKGACAVIGAGKDNYLFDCVAKESEVFEYMVDYFKNDWYLKYKSITSLTDPFLVGYEGSQYEKFYYGYFEQLNRK